MWEMTYATNDTSAADLTVNTAIVIARSCFTSFAVCATDRQTDGQTTHEYT